MSSQTEIVVHGAHEHNLKGVDVSIPRGSLTTVTGVSGSGKSSLAFDTIFQEGQRRFVESLSAYARQFLGQAEKPKVDHIEGLSPTVSIDQKTVNRNPRSTVGTITEVHDHLRLLFARLGEPHCPQCQRPITAQTPEQVVDRVLAAHAGARVMILAPIVHDRKGEYRKELEDLRTQGYVRARIDGEVRRLDEPIALERYERHTIEVVLDRIQVDAGKRGRLSEAIEQAFRLGRGQAAVLEGDRHEAFSSKLACPECEIDVVEMEPRTFSFNSPHGACPQCGGLGETREPDLRLVVPDLDLSIDEGAVAPSLRGNWSLKRDLGLRVLQQVCDVLRIRRDIPFRKLSSRERSQLLEGANGKEIDVEVSHESERIRYRKRERRSWPGVLSILRSLESRGHRAGVEPYLSLSRCSACQGSRLRREALAVRFKGHSIGQLSAMSVDRLLALIEGTVLDGNEALIGERLLRELAVRLRFLERVGLGYLTIERSAATLSGGESQRIRLATQVASQLRGILYVLDEPSIGLHQRDNRRLIRTLEDLRDAGNTVLVVEHDEETIGSSDWVVDVGPGAGSEGGEIIASGPLQATLAAERSITGAFLSRRETIPLPALRRHPNGAFLTVRGARAHNLKGIDVPFPIGLFTCVTGVSGSGKSTLIEDILKRVLARAFHHAEEPPGDHDRIEGMEHLDKVIEIDQSPIGRTPRSNPATYSSVFGLIRDLFASLPEAEVRGYKKGRFSFNVKGGRCEECSGAGIRLVEMQFLADVAVPCEACSGRRFNPETLEVRYRGKSINDVLEMTVAEALEFFANHPKIARILETLARVGLDYVKLGQPSTTLSGGEAQRVKLASQLHRPPTGHTLYLLDEPTTGLHFLDIRKLLEALQALADAGNTVVVIEHNLDVIKSADWIVDLGPEGGDGGGELVYAGPLLGIAGVEGSHTGMVLKDVLRPPRARKRRPRRQKIVDRALDGDICIRGARLHNLKGVDARIPAGSLTVVTGPSGSGKTSLAFDTLFAEGQRRFVECLSTYARQFLGRLERPPLDSIEGLAPAIAIDQKRSGRNPRSTVATTTEIHDYLRLLFSRLGEPHCPVCRRAVRGFTPDAVVRHLLTHHSGAKGRLLAPLFVKGLKHRTLLSKPADLKKLASELAEEGFVRVLIDGSEHRFDEPLKALSRAAEIWLVVDRVVIKESARTRLLDSVAQSFPRGLGILAFEPVEGPRIFFSELPGCIECGYFLEEELNPRMFSFNSHAGACEACHGLGIALKCDPDKLIVRPHLPLFEGALVDRPGDFLGRSDNYFRSVVLALCDEMGADASKPWKSLPRSVRHAILFGRDGKVAVAFEDHRPDRETSFEMNASWRGFCRYVEAWHQSAENEWWLKQLEPLMRRDVCERCEGERLKPAYRAVTVAKKTIGEVGRMTVTEALAWVSGLSFVGADAAVAEQIVRELQNRLRFLDAVGLEYLALNRSAVTLSGGEAQRIRLATQIGNRLTGVIYVLDEPTIGLHPRDTSRLLRTLEDLRDLGNSVVVVEHDRDTIDRADWILDLGPGAGHRGGEIVYAGRRSGLEAAATLTADYVAGRRRVAPPRVPRARGEERIGVRGATANNLKNIDVDFPLGQFIVVTGVSGSGKSSLVMESLARGVSEKRLNKRMPPGLAAIDGLEGISDWKIVDQTPIGTSPKSNPASYIGFMDAIREIMAEAPLAKVRGYTPGRFSFNTSAGRCAACEGRGSIKVEMHFLPDVWITCEDCKGRRYNRETLTIEYRGKTIADILDMEVSEALPFFANHRKIATALKLLEDVGLGYMKLGQPATTLSGGEAQRIKLAEELVRPARGKSLYLLDEPTTGLHFDDVARLVHVLHRLVDSGHTVVLIEHNLDVIASADWIIDLGPEGGDGGGTIVAEGPPDVVASIVGSHTGAALRALRSENGRSAQGQAPGQGRKTLEAIG